MEEKTIEYFERVANMFQKQSELNKQFQLEIEQLQSKLNDMMQIISRIDK